VLGASGRSEEAVELLERTAAGVGIHTVEGLQVREELARALVANDRAEDALPIYEALLERVGSDLPRRANLRQQKAAALGALGRQAEALEILLELADFYRHDPGNRLSVLWELANVYRTLGRSVEAERTYETLASEYADDVRQAVEARRQLAMLRAERDPEAALRELEALEREVGGGSDAPDGAFVGWLYQDLASLNLRLGRLDEARRRIDRILQDTGRAPEWAQSMRALAAAHRGQADNAAAARVLESVIGTPGLGSGRCGLFAGSVRAVSGTMEDSSPRRRAGRRRNGPTHCRCQAGRNR